MKRRDIPMSCARTQVLLDAYIDGDLRPERQQRVDAHLHGCGDCQVSLAAARRVQVSLRDLPGLQAPDVLRDRLAAALPQDELQAAPQASHPDNAAAAPHWQDRFADTVSRIWDAITGQGGGSAAWVRPAGAVAALVLLVFLWVERREPAQPAMMAEYTQEELQEADRQARWALAYLARVTANAGDVAFVQVGDVMGDVIGTHVVGSVTNAVERSLKPGPDKKAPGSEQEEVQTP